MLVSAPGTEDLAGKGLKAIDPARYGSLEHPGDGFSFDIFTQVARALRQGGPALGGLKPQRVLAAGESQSAIALTTYYDGVQPLTHAFDGFFVHSRASVGLPLVGPGEYADLAGGLGGTPAIFRTDLAAPVIDLQAESDVTGILNSVVVRQPDSDTFRLWEVAGTAHADVHLLGPTIADVLDCGAPINNGPLHLVAKAALRGLDEWVRAGQAPPAAPRLDVTSGDPVEIRRDADGIALGGIRTPPVDVPVAVLSGVPGPKPDLLCLLLGSTTPLPAERLAELYPSRADYEQRYDAAADAGDRGGFRARRGPRRAAGVRRPVRRSRPDSQADAQEIRRDQHPARSRAGPLGFRRSHGRLQTREHDLGDGESDLVFRVVLVVDGRFRHADRVCDHLQRSSADATAGAFHSGH